MMFTMRTFLALTGSALVAVVLAACSGNTADGSSQAALAQGTNQVSGHHDPARFLQHFDKNGDGKVQVSELPDRMQDRLGKADTNGDGVISADELTAHFDAMKKEMFAKADKNADGSIEESEVPAERWQHMLPADANKDGKITAAELDAAHASGAIKGFHDGPHGGGGFRHGPPPSTDEILAKFDANKDGVLDSTEIPEPMRRFIDKVDADKDGKITKSELDAARAAMEARRAQHGE